MTLLTFVFILVLMLSRQHRFHGYGSLRFVYAHGQTVRSPLLAVRYTLNAKRQSYRCAVVIGKKTEKSAVKRNRIRRRIYEHFRQNDDKITQPYDIVVTVFTPIVGHLPAGELAQAINKLLNQAGIISA